MYRLKFEKTGDMIYIGHLDQMRIFHQAFRRADLPLQYSKGFNPHPLTYFTHPLPLLAGSYGEYMDVELKETKTFQEIKEEMNQVLPQGMQIKKVIQLKEGSKSPMAITQASDYIITVSPMPQTAKRFFESDAEIEKKTKQGIQRISLRDVLIDYQIGKNTLYLFLKSLPFIKPELIVQHIFSFCKETLGDIDVMRRDNYICVNSQYKNLVYEDFVPYEL